MSVFSQKRDLREITIIVLLSAFITAILIVWGIPLIATFLKELTTNEFIALLTVLISMFGITWQIIVFKLKRVPKLKADLHVETISDHAIITSRIENIGGKTVTPYNVYLFIDEGILREKGYYEFPFLLKHEGGEYDCVLSKICQKEKLDYPKDRLGRGFQNIHTDCIQLRHLSSESILYIAPAESFMEDVVVKLPKPGVYRAIIVFTAKDADCICASKQFIVLESSEGCVSNA